MTGPPRRPPAALAALHRLAMRVPALRRMGVEPWEVGALAGAVALALAVRLVFLALTQNHTLAGDELEYDLQGRFIEAGHWFWSTTPYLIPHPSLWKTPAYPAWVGVWYELLGPDVDRVLLVQTLVVAPLTVALTWLLARRLLGAPVAAVAALIVAVYPYVWVWETRLFSEALAIPLALAVVYLVLDREPAPRRAVAVGALMGVALLLRPSSLFLFAGVAVAWWLAAGLRRGAAMTAVSVGVALLLVAPWTIRNANVTWAYEGERMEEGLVPLSVQDAAMYGTFNAEAANDPKWPYSWRPCVKRDQDILPCTSEGRERLLETRGPLTDTELRRELTGRAREYIADHPLSLVEAFYWNGVTRLWDLRRPSRALEEGRFHARSRGVSWAALLAYYALMPLALAGLWRLRRRLELVLPILGMAGAAMLIFTTVSSSRYRATFEPLIAILAAHQGVNWLSARWRKGG